MIKEQSKELVSPVTSTEKSKESLTPYEIFQIESRAYDKANKDYEILLAKHRKEEARDWREIGKLIEAYVRAYVEYYMQTSTQST